MYHICNNDTLRSICFAYFHFIANYGIILWGNSSYGRKIFTLQKRIIRIMMGAHPRTSCRVLLKKLEILTIQSQYIYTHWWFFVGNQDKFLTNSSAHSIKTRNKHHLHRPIANLSCFHKGASYSGIRIFNKILQSIISLRNENPQLKVAIKIFLHAYSFTLWMKFLHVQMICINDLQDCVTSYTVIILYVLNAFVCFWCIQHPIVWWQPQGSMVCIYKCMHAWKHVRERERESACVRMYVCMWVCVCVSVRACVWKMINYNLCILFVFGW